jgi:hypothetical protein
MDSTAASTAAASGAYILSLLHTSPDGLLPACLPACLPARLPACPPARHTCPALTSPPSEALDLLTATEDPNTLMMDADASLPPKGRQAAGPQGHPADSQDDTRCSDDHMVGGE